MINVRAMVRYTEDPPLREYPPDLDAVVPPARHLAFYDGSPMALGDAARCGPVELALREVTPEMVAAQPVHSFGFKTLPGPHAFMWIDGALWMSDAACERRDQYNFVRKAKGRVLVGGLGLGVVAVALAQKTDVEHVLVLEQSPEVIFLTGAGCRRYPKIQIVQADAWTWQPPDGDPPFDFAWFDIWQDVSLKNLPAMRRLCKRFEPWAMVRECWSRDHLLALQRAKRRAAKPPRYY